eukprot:NODE_463_length_1666_cov_106.226964_g335_i0.p1 GENE.NODE_463_length_1666_cov_106.226964_g335_i0~~NODE_463_length_1666_cov_106.226964_g335_i0.p1  ORF type:complete len:336 (-),score=87.32 NODE_463_length_1666_cov_106.226964_g335_i0:576-1583(-)
MVVHAEIPDQERSAAQKAFRNYVDSQFQERVEKTYREMQENQSVEYVTDMMKKYGGATENWSVWNIMKLLNEIVDESDPDNDLPQHVHAFQTASSLVTRYCNVPSMTLKTDIMVKDLFDQEEWEDLPQSARDLYGGLALHELYSHITDWDWFPLVGFIHDCGKVLATPHFGECPQWSTVGDTFPVGCAFSAANVFADKGFHSKNPDAAVPKYTTPEGMYTMYCGLEKLLLCWGHDEYMAQVMEKSSSLLPPEAAYIVRFHSFYPWHTPKGDIRGYQNLASDYDWKMLPLVRALQKADLYSKSSVLPSFDAVKDVYDGVIQKYFPGGMLVMGVPTP